MNAPINIQRLLPAWEKFSALSGIAPIRDEAHYRQMTALLEALLEESQGQEQHAAMALVEIIGDLIADYEAQQHPLQGASGVEALAFLMAQHGLRQGDLPEIGSQGVVSEILAGKRELNVRQVRALAERFGVSAATFV